MTSPRVQLWRRRWTRHEAPMPLAEAMTVGPQLADEGDCEVLVVALGHDPNDDTASARVKRGMDRARGEGRHLGRPRVAVDVEAAARMFHQGVSLKEIARRLDSNRNTIRRRLHEIGVVTGAM